FASLCSRIAASRIGKHFRNRLKMVALMTLLRTPVRGCSLRESTRKETRDLTVLTHCPASFALFAGDTRHLATQLRRHLVHTCTSARGTTPAASEAASTVSGASVPNAAEFASFSRGKRKYACS